LKKIKQKDIEKHQQKKAQSQAESAVPEIEEKIDYLKYAAIQLVLGTIALIAMMVVLYMLEMDSKHILTILVAYFPYFYIQKTAPKPLHILGWSIYIGIALFAIFFR
jgi:ABC-type transport system involved in cytochrome bd biosynthesis fused ATPase/permease subunit